MPILSEPLGRVLGNRYRLVAALGSGASAHVFLAEDMVLQRHVAVKVLQPALARDEGFLRRFRAEARSVAALNHPHVLQVFDWGEGQDGPYLVLEYLEGGSLYDMLARGRRLSPGQGARIGAQAADGLAYAHARGIVHRDVKPANILFDEDGRVRVADFGVARALSGALTTDPGAIFGTARYASPEQAQGRHLDGRSDVYSLGLVLYEAVTGSVPFVRDTPLATLQARVGEWVPNNPALGPLAAVLAEACSPDAADRLDAALLAERLQVLSDGLAPDGPLPLVHREAPTNGVSGGERREDHTQAMDLSDLTLAGSAALGAGVGGAAGLAALAAGGGLVHSGEPTATIGVPSGAASHVVAELARRRAPRRWPWLVTVLVLLACILTGIGLYIAKARLLTASHRVPSVVGDTVSEATSALRADHFVVKLDAGETSTKVPAGKVIRQDPGRGVSLKEGSTVRLLPSKGEPSVIVPPLDGNIDCAYAGELLAAVHLHARCPALKAFSKTVPEGDIINWSYRGVRKTDPTKAPYGSTITVAVSKGPPPVPVPRVANESFTQAAGTLRADGFVVKEVQAYSTTVPSGQVISSTPGAGVPTLPGTSVTLNVSQGPQVVAVPTVRGDTVAQATAAMQATGFVVAGLVYGPTTGVVFTTDPRAGQMEKRGTTVYLYTEPGPSTGSGPNPSSATASTGTGPVIGR